MRTLLVAGHKGGVGKTTAAINLAALAGQVGRTLLVDADPARGAAVALGLADRPAQRFFEGRRSGVAALFVRDVVPGLDVLSFIDQRHAWAAHFGRVCRTMGLGSLQDRYRLAVLDGPPLRGVRSAPLLRLCEEVLVVMCPEPVARGAFVAFLRALQVLRGPDATPRLAGVLLSDVPVSDPSGAAELRQSFGAGVLPAVVPPDAAVLRATAARDVLCRREPMSEAARAYRAAANWLGLLGGQSTDAARAPSAVMTTGPMVSQER